jgi:hypothetical protein
MAAIVSVIEQNLKGFRAVGRTIMKHFATRQEIKLTEESRILTLQNCSRPNYAVSSSKMLVAVI